MTHFFHKNIKTFFAKEINGTLYGKRIAPAPERDTGAIQTNAIINGLLYYNKVIVLLALLNKDVLVVE